ncbi:MAG: M20/M25/M40 family metallo-hydrolase, partial [Ignavibacteria bacterium]
MRKKHTQLATAAQQGLSFSRPRPEPRGRSSRAFLRRPPSLSPRFLVSHFAGKTASFELPCVTVSLQTQIEKVVATTSNIVGLLPGNDPGFKDEAVLVGAHMDHLGMGGEGSGSLSPGSSAIHHGADDNASGSAGLLELAQYFSAHRGELKRTIIFAAFSGEELGLLGSAYYVKNPPYPLDKTIAMLNMDMVGRLRDSVLVVEGMGTS